MSSQYHSLVPNDELEKLREDAENWRKTGFRMNTKIETEIADAELGQLVRKMPSGSTLANYSGNWYCDTQAGRYTSSGFGTPEQALTAALQSEGVESREP